MTARSIRSAWSAGVRTRPGRSCTSNRTSAACPDPVTLGAAYEGGPGLVHGGVLSLMFDHAMGTAVFVAGHAAMTVSLEVRYRAPTQLETPLQVAAWVDRVEGRKVFVGAEVRAADEVTASATGVFLRLTRENVERIFPADRIPADELQ